MSTRTPSMDDKDAPLPPRRSHEQYEADKAAGIHPYGKAHDGKSWTEHARRCKVVGVEPEDVDERELARLEAAS